MNFKKEDVIKIANELVEDAVMFYDGGDYRQDGYECSFCRGTTTATRDEFKHDLDCSVLVAYDLLIKSGELLMKYKKGDKVIYIHTGRPRYCAVGYVEGFSHMGISRDLVYDVNFSRPIFSYRTYGKYLISYSKEALLKLNLDSTLKEK